jgi:hypothetical protein
VLSKSRLLGLLVDRAMVNDTALLPDDRNLTPEVCASADRAVVREAAYLIEELLSGFSYAQSAAFASLIAGKSAAVVAMQKKLAADPVRQKQDHERFSVALQALLVSDQAYEFVAPGQAAALDRLRAILAAVQNER